ncbi:MAG: hypothetical protein ACFFBK_05390, partial [Promethearchaeota archaeon]
TFSMVDEEYAEKGWFSCGWYHSHPGLDIFFSSTDIRNQLGWQTPNPSAVGLVFDHTFLEKPGDLGFRSFRLENPAKGQMSDYHEVKAIVDPPDSIEFYIKLMELINNVHSKEPQILEINELPDFFVDVAFPSESQIFSKTPKLDSQEILNMFKEGISNFIEQSFDPLFTFLNSWSESLTKNSVEKNIQMRKDIITIKDNLSQGISNLQKDFKFALKEKLNELDTYIDDKFEVFDSDHEYLRNKIDNIKIELKEQFNILFKEKLKDNIDKIVDQYNNFRENLKKIKEKSLNSSESLTQQIPILDRLSKVTNSIGDIILNQVNTKSEEFIDKFTKIANKIIGNLINLNKENKSFLSDLKAAIILLESSKTPLQNKIESRNVEIKNLQKENSRLNKENQELLAKIKQLEKKGD